jgi:hypothetical protein
VRVYAASEWKAHELPLCVGVVVECENSRRQEKRASIEVSSSSPSNAHVIRLLCVHNEWQQEEVVYRREMSKISPLFQSHFQSRAVQSENQRAKVNEENF